MNEIDIQEKMPISSVKAGQKYGMLTAIGPTGETRNGHRIWECLCDCGNTSYVQAGHLTSGNSTSCGCKRINNLTGQKFGKLTAVKPTNEYKNNNVIWECLCDCGETVKVASVYLTNGTKKSCGFCKSREPRNKRK